MRLTPLERQPNVAHELELARLYELSSELAGVIGADPAEFLTGLPQNVSGSLDVDNALYRSHSAFRQLFLSKLAVITARRWRTPRTGEHVPFPGTPNAYDYAYDRQHPPRMLDERLSAKITEQDRKVGGAVCSSGMAAIHVLMQSLAYILRRSPAHVGVLASYFESLTQFRVGAFAGRWHRHEDSDSLASSIHAGRVQVVYIEPVQYNWKLDVVDFEPILSAIDAADEPPVVVLDTTLSGNCAPLQAIEEALRCSCTPLLASVRSGLKLDEEGFELGNLGVIKWWPRNGAGFDELPAVVSACRVVSGASIGWHEACALAPPFVLRTPNLRAYTEAIFASNCMLYEAVELSGEIFRSKVYPEAPWGAPFVLFQLSSGDEDAYRTLAQLLYRESARRGLGWVMSGSFGFRTERFETILPGEQTRPGEAPEGVLKIACGCYQGARFWHIVDMLNELASFHSLEDATRAWSTATRHPGVSR